MGALHPEKKATVVIIDNDEAMRHSLEWLIQSCGHEVVSYDSGLSYLDASVGAAKPDCVVLDIHMPEMNGLELYGVLKTRDPDLAVIFITGYPDQVLAEVAGGLEAAGFFTKPLDTDALLICLERILNRRKVIESTAKH